MKDFIFVKEPFEEEVVRDPVQFGRRTKENLSEIIGFFAPHDVMNWFFDGGWGNIIYFVV